MCLKRKTCLESLRRVREERRGGGEEVAEGSALSSEMRGDGETLRSETANESSGGGGSCEICLSALTDCEESNS